MAQDNPPEFVVIARTSAGIGLVAHVRGEQVGTRP
jgi:hypothetical protein